MDNQLDRLRAVGNARWVDEFKQFLLRGNVIDLAVAVVLGAAFTGVVNAIVDNLITPLIGAIGGQPDFSDVGFTINNAFFGIGHIINAALSFVIVAAVIFFVIKPMNVLINLAKVEAPADPTEKKCPFCQNAVPIAATRCGFCTSCLPTDGAAARDAA